MSGVDVRENELGFVAVRLHYTADPAKDATWVEKARFAYPDPNAWAQEMEINWWVATGTRVYPEFNESLHVKAHSHRPRKVIYRAWDFGWIAPACLIAQIDSKDRLVVLKELVGREQTTSEFAKTVIDRCAQWYPHHVAGFQDFCDPAGQQVRSIASEQNETRDVEVLNGLGIYPSWEYGWSRKDGRALIHQLLRLRTDDTPGMYVDPTGCPTLIQGFLGKYVFPESREGLVKDEPKEDNHPWSDVHACLRYLATGLYSALGLRRFKYQPVIPENPPDYHGYGTPTRRPPHAREPWSPASGQHTTLESAHAAWKQINGARDARD